jgi:hypothetical protein
MENFLGDLSASFIWSKMLTMACSGSFFLRVKGVLVKRGVALVV